VSQLIAIEKLNPIEVFTDAGLDEIINRIEKEAKSFVIDMTTEQGRDELNKLSKKVNRSKTLLDDMGKSLTEDLKKKSGIIDAKRRMMRDRLDKIKDEIRQPLTDYENAEKQRTDYLQGRLNEINVYMIDQSLCLSFTQEDFHSHIEKVSAIDLSNWQEFTQAATASKEKALKFLQLQLEQRIIRDKEYEEFQRLREKEEAQKQKEREEKIAADAAQAERDRIAAEKEREDAETARREADRSHKAKVNNDILAALIGLPVCISEEQGKEIITAIAKGLIPNLKITY
jgi:hypothetical protein